MIELECGCTERTDVAALCGRVEVRAGGCDIHGPAPDVDAELDLDARIPILELMAVQRSLVVLREVLLIGASTLLAQQSIARAVAELEAAERDLTKNDGHGARRG